MDWSFPVEVLPACLLVALIVVFVLPRLERPNKE